MFFPTHFALPVSQEIAGGTLALHQPHVSMSRRASAQNATVAPPSTVFTWRLDAHTTPGAQSLLVVQAFTHAASDCSFTVSSTHTSSPAHWPQAISADGQAMSGTLWEYGCSGPLPL